MKQTELLGRARRAYERGRARRAARVAGFVLPMIGVSLVCCEKRGVTLVAGTLLLAAAVGFQWRGGAWARAVGPGLLAGALPLLMPLAAGVACGTGSAACARYGWPVCVLSGLLAGTIVVRHALRQQNDDRRTFLAAAGALALLAGSLGCVLVGLGGVAAMGAGLALASAPAVLRPVRT
jgi:hypothetical protein